MIIGPGRPEKGYRTAEGVRVPSVTEITGQLGSADGLLHHLRAEAKRAWDDGASLDGALWASHRRMEEAGDHGTRVHDAIQVAEFGAGYLGDDEAVLDGLRAWKAWRCDESPTGGAGLRMLACEIPMVCDRMILGGTLDYLATDREGRLWILDVKTGRRLWGKHLIQLGLYSMLWSRSEVDPCAVELREEVGRHVHGVIPVHLPREAPGVYDARPFGGKGLRRIERAARDARRTVAALEGLDEATRPWPSALADGSAGK